MPAPTDEDLSRATAFFSATTDMRLLRDLLQSIRPRAARMAEAYNRRGNEPPPPRDLPPASEAASQSEAIATLQAVKDFASLQALARAIGRRAEELVASN